MPHIKVKSGIEWFYEIDGEGEILLFIHGWGVDHRIWRQQSKYFSQFYKVLTIDLPGHGESSFKKITLSEMGEDLNMVLSYLGLSHFSVVGSSLGGMVALKLYEISPNKFKRLIFVGSMPKFAKSAEYPYGLDMSQMKKLEGQLQTAYPSIVNVFFRSLFTKEERESRRFKWLQKFRQSDEVPMKQALAEYLDILEHEDLREVLRGANLPLQFINGTHDEICNHQTVEFLKTLCPTSRFDYFENCGHFPFLSKPHEFNQILENFLKKS